MRENARVYLVLGAMAIGAVFALVVRPVEFFAIVGIFAALQWSAGR